MPHPIDKITFSDLVTKIEISRNASEDFIQLLNKYIDSAPMFIYRSKLFGVIVG